MKHLLALVIASVLAVVFIFFLPADSAVSQNSSPNKELERNLLVESAKVYMADQGTSLPEAIRRLQLQDRIGQLNARLTAKQAETFAGLWIQHDPEFRVIVRFTRDGEKIIRPYVEGGPLQSIVEPRSAKATLARMEEAEARAAYVADSLGITADSGVDLVKNRVVLYVTDRARLVTALQATGARLPNEVDIIEVDTLMGPSANIYAGLRLHKFYSRPKVTECTTGFSVRNIYTGARGVTTAAHCPDRLYFRQTRIPVRGGAYSGSYDIQWHTTPGYRDRPFIRDGYSDSWDPTPYYRKVYRVKGRRYQSVGDYVCHYGFGGNIPEYTCGYIRSKTFRPGYVPSARATFILVRNSRIDLTDRGDSGGPWFTGGTALGIHSGGNQADKAIYMPINYVNPFNIRVIRAR